MNYTVRQLFEELTLKEYQINHSHRDVAIGEVEYWAEEDERFAAVEWHPVGHLVDVYNREIEHIYHFSVQKRSVPLAPRHKRGRLQRR